MAIKCYNPKPIPKGTKQKVYTFQDRINSINVDNSVNGYGEQTNWNIITLEFDQGSRLTMTGLTGVDINDLIEIGRSRQLYTITVSPIKKMVEKIKKQVPPFGLKKRRKK